MMRSLESASSVFYHSQEEDPQKTGADTLASHRDVLAGPPYDSMMDSSPVSRDADPSGRLGPAGWSVNALSPSVGHSGTITSIFMNELQIWTVRHLLDAAPTAPTR